MEPLVSIIIPTFNRRELLSEAIGSAMRQSYDRLEIIVVDDCSTEDVEGLVRRFSSMDSRVRFFRRAKNGGVASSRNVGIERASGEFVQFLDSDDLYHAEKTRVQVEAHATDPGKDFVVCQSACFNSVPGDMFTLWNTFVGDEPLMRYAKHNLPWQTGAALWRRNSLDRFGHFSPGCRFGEDTELFFRALAMGAKVRMIPMVLQFYRFHDGGQLSRTFDWASHRMHRDVFLPIAATLEQRGALTSELAREIRTTLVRIAWECLGVGAADNSADVLRAAAEIGGGNGSAELLLRAAAEVSEGKEAGALFEHLKRSGHDWTVRGKWVNTHLVYNEPLEPVPTRRRYGSRRGTGAPQADG